MSRDAKSEGLSTKQLAGLSIVGTVGVIALAAGPFLMHGFRRTAPYVAASPSLLKKQISIVSEHLRNSKTASMIDLGSGDGSVVFSFAKAFPMWQKLCGVDNNWVLVASSTLRNRDARVSFRVGDIYRQPDLSEFDALAVCLVPSMLSSVETMLQERAKPGALVICGRFPLPNWKPIQTLPGDAVDGVWVYKVAQRQ